MSLKERMPRGWISDILLAGLICVVGTPIEVLIAGFPGDPDRPGLSRVVLNEMMFSVPAVALFAAVIALVVYGAAAPADRSMDAVRAGWSVRLSTATGLCLFLIGLMSILHSVYHPHRQSI